MSRETEFRVYTGRELIETPTEEEVYLIQDMLWEGDHVFLLGKEKSGKSIFAMQMMCSLTSGSAFLSRYEVPIAVPVLYVQAEGKKRDTIERLKAMCNEQGIAWNPDNFFLLYYHSIALDTPDGYNQFLQLTAKIPKPKVVFLDPLYMSMSGDLIDNLAARNMVRNVRRIGDLFNCTIVIIHHENRPVRDREGKLIQKSKSETIFGSFVWSAFADHVIAIEPKGTGFRRLSCDTQRTGKVLKDIELNMIQPYPLYYEIVGLDQKPYVSEIYNEIRCVDMEEGITRNQLEANTKLNISAVEKSLAILLKELKVVRLNPGCRPVRYILNPYTQPIKILKRKAAVSGTI